MRRTSPLIVLLALTAQAGCQDRSPEEAVATEAASVPLYETLGDHHYAITTDVPEAQRYFDQGLRLTYAFNHAEAIRAFDEAARLDPGCAMCAWGSALAYGPNINAPMDAAAAAKAFVAVQRARELASGADPRERALIDALATRYADPAPEDRAALDSAYARAMGEVLRRYPDDPEVATLYAESLMDLSPWYYWNADGSPRPSTPDIVANLERVIERTPNHPGACHFYIHAVEAVEPEKAVACAERLAGLMPGAGHLVHMPGHIYIRVGRYADAIRANEHAVHADETYIQDQRPGMGTYTLGYYPHNYDFLAFAAMMVARSEQSLAAARKVESLVPADMLGAPGLGFLQQGATGPLRLLVRFGRWDEILAVPEPSVELAYVRGTWRYARGMAFAAKGDPATAEAELAAVLEAAEDAVLQETVIGFNPGSEILRIAGGVLAGEIAAKKGDLEGAIERLREAAGREDALTYGEPPDWPVPVRHHLGAVLLQAGRAAGAETAYREDLKRFPENAWSLRGLASSLAAQGKADEAAEVEARLASVTSGADVTLVGSRF